MQTHPCGGFSMRAERMLVKQEHQAGALPKLVGDRSLDNELLALGNKVCREIGAIRRARSRHDLRPCEKISFVSIPMSLQVITKPASANLGVNCETEHLAWVLSLWQGNQLALVLNATTLSTRFTVL